MHADLIATLTSNYAADLLQMQLSEILAPGSVVDIGNLTAALASKVSKPANGG
jgi:hypothetical protein